jgi:hypothetical protein
MCFESLLGLKRGVAMQAVENQGSGMWVSEVVSH